MPDQTKPDDVKKKKSHTDAFMEILRDRQKAQGKSSLINRQGSKFQQARSGNPDTSSKRGRLLGRLKPDAPSQPQSFSGPPKSSSRFRPKF